MLQNARAPRAVAIVLVAIVALAPLLLPAFDQVEAQEDGRYFSDTGFRIDNDTIWDYFNKRGKTRTFGLPTSRTFRLMGMPTQFYQRHVLQVAGGGVQTLNLLDDGWLPYTTMNGSTFPSSDPALASGAPSANTPRYDVAIVEYLQKNTPDEHEGQAVNFYKTFSSTVTLGDAFPDGGGSEGLLPLLNLELWGQPTSRPQRDPNNNDFVYQRFQRGVMHYDVSCKCTQGLLLADYMKSVMTGQNLPVDLAAQAGESRLFRQYDWANHNGPVRPDVLPDSDMGNAFRPSRDTAPPGNVTLTRAATATTTPAKPTVTPTPSKATATPGKSSTSTSKTSSGPTPVPGDPPQGDPKGVALKISEGGKDAKKSGEKEYADGRQNWYEVRYERPTTYAAYRAGPITTYSKAILTKDEETAKQIFDEQKALNPKFPEAKEKVGAPLELNTTTSDEDLGDQASGLTACKESNCNNSKDDEFYLHHRIVVQVTNMVSVIYVYGLDDPEGNTKQNARRLASIVVSRWR